METDILELDLTNEERWIIFFCYDKPNNVKPRGIHQLTFCETKTPQNQFQNPSIN